MLFCIEINETVLFLISLEEEGVNDGAGNRLLLLALPDVSVLSA